MQLFVVLPAVAFTGKSRTVSVEAGPPESTTIGDLKKAIQVRSAQAYKSDIRDSSTFRPSLRLGTRNCNASSSYGSAVDNKERLGGIPAALQRLTLGGRHLRDDQTLADCVISGCETLHLVLPLPGGIDFQHRDGSRFGGGGQMSESLANADRRERLRKLALETIDLNKDPYFMRNHLGSYECKLCLTLHNNEGNYLAHTQGKRHQENLARRAAREAKEQQYRPNKPTMVAARRMMKIGRPGYKVTKARDLSTRQRSLIFEIDYPQAEEDVQPRHRFMSAFEQRVESAKEREWQYLLFACEPYETIGFKIPNVEIDKGEGRFLSQWDPKARKFLLQLYFRERGEGEAGRGASGEGGRGTPMPVASPQNGSSNYQQGFGQEGRMQFEERRTQLPPPPPPQHYQPQQSLGSFGQRHGHAAGYGYAGGPPPPPPPPPRHGGY